MNIVVRCHLFPPEHCAGAERMLQALLEALIARGHRCQVHLSRRTFRRRPYRVGGIEVYPLGNGWHDAAHDADVLVTHLDQTSETVGIGLALHKPVVQVLHNTHAPTRMWASCYSSLLVYNSEWMADELGNDPRGIIVRPPVRAADYAVPDHQGFSAPYITLINTSQGKGGLVWSMLAALMPDLDFLGVGGAYAEQLDPQLHNTRFLSHGSQQMRNVYRNTAILLMPSEYESWGRTGVEAMASGIPVIATPTPGLRESLGEAGIFRPRDDLDAWCSAIRDLLMDREAYVAASERALKRSAELDPTDDLARWVDAVEAL